MHVPRPPSPAPALLETPVNPFRSARLAIAPMRVSGQLRVSSLRVQLLRGTYRLSRRVRTRPTGPYSRS
jgi:hypothetical protein